MLVGAGLVLAAGLGLAQDTPPATQPAAPARPVEKRVTLSPAEMSSQAAAHIRDMQQVLRRVVELQERAREQRDVIRVNCVNDKLLQIKQLLNIADAANTNLQEALARNDEESRYHEFGRISIAYQQTSALKTESENCIGEDLSFVGDTDVAIDRPVDLEDLATPQQPDFPVVEPPPMASPFM